MLVLLLVQMLVQIVSYRVHLPPLDAVQQVPRGGEGVETRGRGQTEGRQGYCTVTGRKLKWYSSVIEKLTAFGEKTTVEIFPQVHRNRKLSMGKITRPGAKDR